MTEEDFLKRWSRRKREADVAQPTPSHPAAGDADAVVPDRVVSNRSAEAPQPEFDPATLPPIESITAVSDVTAFLRAGVPAELTRAALRRVWTTDPAIRDFVGLAENAWDFTDPNAMTGFGPLESTEEVRRMIAQVVDRVGEMAQPQGAETDQAEDEIPNVSSASGTSATSGQQGGGTPAEIANAPVQPAETPAQSFGSQVLLQSNREDTAAQRDVAESAKKSKQISQRIHGTALPR